MQNHYDAFRGPICLRFLYQGRRNRGLGLNNVKEILDKYDNIILETEMEDNTFRQNY